MICYAFPLAHEAAPLLKICTQKESFSIGGLHCTLGNFDDRPVLIALVGMGRVAAGARVAEIFKYFEPGVLVLAGYGGALVPQLKVGQIIVSTNYSSKDVISFLRLLNAFAFGVFCTEDHIAGTRAQRDRVAHAGRGQVIEMETAAVAEVVDEHDIPFVAVRAISDDYAHTLPVRALAAGFDPARGRATPLRLLAHLATHWQEVRPFFHFVSNLSLARRNLTSFLRQVNEDLPRNY
jgi:adenosylhomocysteine nucleosidase